MGDQDISDGAMEGEKAAACFYSLIVLASALELKVIQQTFWAVLQKKFRISAYFHF